MTSATADTTTTTSLRALLRDGADREAIASYLNSLSREERYEQALGLGGKDVGRLYDACTDGPVLSLDDLVPADLPADAVVIHQGRNSLPAFSSFQKRFTRTKGDDVIGYNHQTMAFATGPGFFVVQPGADDADVPGELYFDYTAAPSRNDIPAAWPAFKPNDAGISNLVYKNMKDYMRSVAEGVMVGTAYKLGKRQNAYFLLCRK